MINRKKTIVDFTFFILTINFIAHAFQIKPAIYSSILLMLVMLLISNLEYSTYLLFIIHPFFNLITLKVGSTSLYYIFIAVYIFKNIYFYISKGKSKFLIDRYMIFTVILIFTSGNLFGNISLTYISWLILTLLFLVFYKNPVIKLYNIINFYTLSFIYSSILGYIAIINNIKTVFPVELGYVWNNGNITLRFVGLIGETNAYAQISIVLISINIINMLLSKDIKEKLRYMIYIVTMIVFSLLTYSKMFIISIIILMFLFAGVYIKESLINNNQLKKVLFSLPIILFMFIMIAFYIKNNIDSDIISNYIVRFSKKDLSTGRFDVYKYFFTLLSENSIYLLFGIGFYKYDIPWGYNEGVIGKHAHNIFLEGVVLGGIIGFVILVLLLLVKVINSKKYNLNNLLYIPIVIFLITGISLHSIVTNYFYFILIFIISIFNDKDYLKKLNEKYYRRG